MRGGVNVKINKDAIIEEMKNTDNMAFVSAYLYAINAIKYGVDVLEKWDTAERNSANLEKAYVKGYYEGLKGISAIKAEIKQKIKEENYGVISDHTHEDGLEEALEIIDKHINREGAGE